MERSVIMKKSLYRQTALVMALVFGFGLFAAPGAALAQEAAGAAGSAVSAAAPEPAASVAAQDADPVDLDAINAEIKENSRLFFDGVDSSTSDTEMEDQKVYDTLTELIDTGGDPKEFAKWASKKLLYEIMGIKDYDPQGETLAKMDTVIKQNQELSNKIGLLNEKVIKADLVKEINNFMKQLWDGSFKDYYGSLRYYDTQIAAAGSDQARIKALSDKRLNDLVYGIPASTTLNDELCQFDKDTMTFGNYLVQPLNVIYDEKVPTADLFEIYHQVMKRTYHWEHQSYENWAGFQNYALSSYISMAGVDKLSLTARIQAIDAWNAAHPTEPQKSTAILTQRITSLNAQVEQAKKLTAQVVVARPGNVRYYQWPGHERLVYTQTVEKKRPEEPNKSYGVHYFMSWAQDNYQGIIRENKLSGLSYCNPKWIPTSKWSKRFACTIIPIPSFWQGFFQYDGTTASADYAWLQAVRGDYGGSTALKDIFFSAAEGGLTAPAGANANWKYVLQPSTDYPLHYWDGGLWRGDRMIAYATDQSADTPQEVILTYYHEFSNEASDDKGRYISIGVASGSSLGDTAQAIAGAEKSIDFETTAEDTASTGTSGTSNTSGTAKASSPATGITAQGDLPLVLTLILCAGCGVVVLWRRRTH